jgi:hypothetical protein
VTVIPAPEIFPTPPDGKKALKRIFMAGGITGCPDWQKEYISALKDSEGFLFNPRRDDFDVKNPHAAREQIEWEFAYLRRCHAVSFWFPSESLCPIVLFELGAWSMSDKKIFVGCHPSYQRRYDVNVQLKLARPEVAVVQSLVELTSQVKRWVTHD